MLKKLLLITLFIAGSTLYAAPNGGNKNKKMIVNDLVTLPFPGGKLFKTGKIKLDAEQRKQLATKVRPIMHGKYNPSVQEIFMLEKSIQRDIIKKAGTLDEKLKSKIEKIAKLKHEAMEYKVQALLNIKSILTKEQWKVWVSN